MKLPKYAQSLFKPRRYKVIRGGRGSAKSHSIARVLLALGSEKKLRILCGREFQNSISESVHRLLSDIIKEEGLTGFFITNTHIKHKSGTEFIFKGLRNNIESVKSMEAIDILWIEEADKISQKTWDIVVPTIRKENSEIWISYNPHAESDPIHNMFVVNQPPEGSLVIKVTWKDNPWFPEVLKVEMEHMYRTNPDKAAHVWGGECRTMSDAQIFNGKWLIDGFEINDNWEGPYQGADWGFSADPTTLVRLYIDTKKKNLMIRHALAGFHVDIDDTPELFDRVEGSRKTKIRADNSRPETINYIRRQGFDIEAAKKWSGSVEDGVEFLKSFNKIIIHPSCHSSDPNKYCITTEARRYCYKVDRLTGDVTTKIIDEYNHFWDAIRYALQPLIKHEASILDVL